MVRITLGNLEVDQNMNICSQCGGIMFLDPYPFVDERGNFVRTYYCPACGHRSDD